MHFSLGQHGFGPAPSNGGGAFGTEAKGGGPVQRFTQPGHSPPSCPSGARSVATGSYGTGAETQSWRDCEMQAEPVTAAPPPPSPAPDIIITSQVSPAIQTQISPQISPVMTQIQDSPGAGVVAAPQQVAPAPMVAEPTLAPAFDVEAERERIRQEEAARVEAERIAAEWQRLEEEQARREREAAEEEERRVREQQAAAERYAAAEAQRYAFLAEQRAAEEQAMREAAERAQAEAEAAREAAERAQAEAAAAPMPAPMGPAVSVSMPAPEQVPAPVAAPVEVTMEREEPTNLTPILIAAAVGIGVLFLTQGKKRGRK